MNQRKTFFAICTILMSFIASAALADGPLPPQGTVTMKVTGPGCVLVKYNMNTKDRELVTEYYEIAINDRRLLLSSNRPILTIMTFGDKKELTVVKGKPDELHKMFDITPLRARGSCQDLRDAQMTK